jgi:hypothetical protein
VPDFGTLTYALQASLSAETVARLASEAQLQSRSEKNQISGYLGIDGSGYVDVDFIPDIPESKITGLGTDLANKAELSGGNSFSGDQSVDGKLSTSGANNIEAGGEVHSHGQKIDFGHSTWGIDRTGVTATSSIINSALAVFTGNGRGGKAVIPPGIYNWDDEIVVPDFVHLHIESGVYGLRLKSTANTKPHIRILGSNSKVTIDGLLESQCNTPHGIVKFGPDTVTGRMGRIINGNTHLFNDDPGFAFTSGMVGLFVEVKNAGPPGVSGGHLDTKIDTFVNANEVILHAAAQQSVTGAVFRVGPASSTLGNTVDGRGTLRGARYIINSFTQVAPPFGHRATINSGSVNLVAPDATFKQSDADAKVPIAIKGAGPSGGLLATFIDVYYPADGSVDLGVAASTSVVDADYAYRTGATISLSDPTLVNTASGSFTTAGIVGKRVVIDGAGPGGGILDTTIDSVPTQNGKQFRLSSPAITAVGNAAYRIGNGATLTAGNKVVSIPIGLTIDPVMIGMAFTGVNANVSTNSGLIPPFHSIITAVDTVAKTITLLDTPPVTISNTNYRIQSDCGIEFDNEPNGAGGNGTYQNTARDLRVEQFGTMERRVNEANANTVIDLQPRRISQLLHHGLESGEDLVIGGFANACPDLEAMVRIDGASLGRVMGVQGEPGGVSRPYLIDALPGDNVRTYVTGVVSKNVYIDITSNMSLGGTSNGETVTITDRDNWTLSRVRPMDGLVHKIKAGTISDADFIRLAESGLTGVDTTNKRVYVRMGGTWYYAPYISSPASSTIDLKTVLVNMGLITGSGATPLDLNGGMLTSGKAKFLSGLIEAPPVAHGSVGGSVSCDVSVSSVHTLTLTGDTTISVSNVSSTGTVYLTLEVSNASNYAVTLPAAFKWPSGAAGSWNGEAMWTWMTRDGGTIWKMNGASLA